MSALRAADEAHRGALGPERPDKRVPGPCPPPAPPGAQPSLSQDDGPAASPSGAWAQTPWGDLARPGDPPPPARCARRPALHGARGFPGSGADDHGVQGSRSLQNQARSPNFNVGCLWPPGVGDLQGTWAGLPSHLVRSSWGPGDPGTWGPAVGRWGLREAVGPWAAGGLGEPRGATDQSFSLSPTPTPLLSLSPSLSEKQGKHVLG